MKSVISFFRSLVALLVVGLSFGTLNVFQILTLPVRFFSVRLFRKLLFRYALVCAGVCHWWMMKVYRFRPKFILDPMPPGENAIIICNHQAFADVVVMLQFSMLLRRPGDLKYFVKDSLKWLPGPGWSLWFYDSIFLKRNWDTDTRKIEKAFAHIKDYDLSFLLMTFPEGTRQTPKKLAASQKYMRSLGIEPFQNVLCPRSKGLWATTQALGNRIDAIYDLTIDYNLPQAPSFWKFISGTLPDYTLRVRRYPMGEVPMTQDAQKNWLIERFREKDKTR